MLGNVCIQPQFGAKKIGRYRSGTVVEFICVTSAELENSFANCMNYLGNKDTDIVTIPSFIFEQVCLGNDEYRQLMSS